MLRILNAAHRNGGIMLRGECGVLGVTESYRMKTPVTLEPLDKALQEISAMHQNIYWRESPASGVRVADSDIKARLLRLKLREFRVIEDREPDAVMADLWRTPEVTAFLRKNHVHFSRRPVTAKKVISPPMIFEMKNATVADILDRIAAGYRQDPPRSGSIANVRQKRNSGGRADEVRRRQNNPIPLISRIALIFTDYF